MERSCFTLAFIPLSPFATFHGNFAVSSASDSPLAPTTRPAIFPTMQSNRHQDYQERQNQRTKHLSIAALSHQELGIEIDL